MEGDDYGNAFAPQRGRDDFRSRRPECSERHAEGSSADGGEHGNDGQDRSRLPRRVDRFSIPEFGGAFVSRGAPPSLFFKPFIRFLFLIKNTRSLARERVFVSSAIYLNSFFGNFFLKLFNKFFQFQRA